MWTQGRNGTPGAGPGPWIGSMAMCMNNAVLKGFKESFRMTARGLYSIQRSRYYRPEQVRIIQAYQVEGAQNANNAGILYTLETSDGLKGTLMLTSASANGAGMRFMQQAEDIQRSMQRHDHNVC